MMKNLSSKIISCIMGLIAGWLISCAYAEQELNAEEIIGRCVKDGAIAVVEGLVLEKKWERVTDNIATADDEWIEVARCLFHGVYFGEDDWAYSLFLPAVVEALRKKPTAVLGFEYSGISLLNVCSLPFDEDLAAAETYMQEVLPRLDELAVIGRRINSDLAEVCAMRMRLAYERKKMRIRERETLERVQDLLHQNNESSP